MRLLIYSLILLLPGLFIGCGKTNEISTESLLLEMVDREKLAQFPEPEYSCKQFSSYDQNSREKGKEGWFANSDRSWFLRTENNDGRREFVLFDAKGPGAVVRFWSTVAQYGGKGTLRFYIDGASEPEIEGRFPEILSGGLLFEGPLAASVSELTDYIQRGHNLYLPVPYAKQCKITYESDGVTEEPGAARGEAFYYNINYRSYPENTNVKSFSLKDLTRYSGTLQKVQKELLGFELGNVNGADRELQEDILLKTGQTAEIKIEGARAINEISVKLKAYDLNQALRSTVLKIEFDGDMTVWCPVGDFYGTGYKIAPFKSWYSKVDQDGMMTCKWIMPFKSDCKIELENLSEQEVTVEEFGVTSAIWQWNERSMYFGAGWHEKNRLQTRQPDDKGSEEERGRFDVNYVTLKGKGVLVGNGVVLYNTTDAWWGEGDEKIFVDNEAFPSHFGTGSEDFYGYAWSNPNNFSHPFIAQPEGEGAIESGYVSNLRYRALDGIPFQSKLQFDMEMWHWGETVINYAPVSYWYMLPGGQSNLAASEEQAKQAVAMSKYHFYLKGFLEKNIFSSETLVSISSEEKDLEIRYTTDGKEPNKSSYLYKAPFRINKSLTVKAKGFSKKGYATETLSGDFINQKPRKGDKLSNPEKGLTYDYYALPDIIHSTKQIYESEVTKSGISTSVSYPDMELAELFALVFKGYVKIETPGVYTFYTKSNDGSMLFIDNKLIVDNDGPHGARVRYGQVALGKGYHPIKIEYKQIGASKHLEAFISGPGIKNREILPEELWH